MSDRRIRLEDHELLYLRTLVVDDLIRAWSGRKRPTYESVTNRSLLVRRLEGAIGGGRAGRVTVAGRRVLSLAEARGLRSLPPWVERKLLAAPHGEGP